MLEGLRSPTPALALGVLLHDVGKPGTFRVADRIRFDGHVELGERIARDILTRLRFSNAEIEQVIALIANHMRFTHVHEMRESTLKRMLRMDRFEEHLELHRLDCSSSHGHLENYEFAKSKFEQSPPGGTASAAAADGRRPDCSRLCARPGFLAHAGGGRRRAARVADSQQGGGAGAGAIDVRAAGSR